MTVNYFEKGYGLIRALKAAGYKFISNDNTQAADFLGRQSPTIDAAVQTIIDNYDPLPDAKTGARKRLREHATTLVLAVYPGVYPIEADVRAIYNHLTDCQATGQRMDSVEAIKDKFLVKRAAINLMDDYVLIEVLDVTVGW